MEYKLLGRLLVQYALLRGGVTVCLGWALGLLLGIGTGMIGLLGVFIGGVITGVSAISARPTGPSRVIAQAAPFVETLDPLAHAGDPPGSTATRRFFYGLGIFLIGGGLLVLAG